MRVGTAGVKGQTGGAWGPPFGYQASVNPGTVPVPG
jgi:hypothetical protein